MTIHNSQSAGGFTLIEVVLVATVLVLLLVGALPRFHETTQRLRAERAAFEFAQLLRYAHERAVAQGDVIVLNWDAEARRARLQSDGGQEAHPESTDCPEEQVLLSPALESAVVPGDISVTLVREDRLVACVSFFPDGTSEPTTLHLVQRGRDYTIAVDASTSQVLINFAQRNVSNG